MRRKKLSEIKSTTEYTGPGFLRRGPSLLDLDELPPRELGRRAVMVDPDDYIREHFEPLSDEAAEFLRGYYEGAYFRRAGRFYDPYLSLPIYRLWW